MSRGSIGTVLAIYNLIYQEKQLKKIMEKEAKQAKASEVIKNSVGFALGAALLPVPGVDLLAVSAVQLNMMRTLAKLYGVSFIDSLGKNIVSAVAGSSAARLGASLVKAIPGVGTVIGEFTMPVLSGASTYALGRVIANHLHQGGSLENLDIKKAQKGYETEIENGKKITEEVSQTNPPVVSNGDETADKLQKMADLHKAGVLTDEEFKQVKARLLSQL